MVAERRDDSRRLSLVRPQPQALPDPDEVRRIEQTIVRLVDERRALLRAERPFLASAAAVMAEVGALDERITGLWARKRQALAEYKLFAARAGRRRPWEDE